MRGILTIVNQLSADTATHSTTKNSSKILPIDTIYLEFFDNILSLHPKKHSLSLYKKHTNIKSPTKFIIKKGSIALQVWPANAYRHRGH